MLALAVLVAGVPLLVRGRPATAEPSGSVTATITLGTTTVRAGATLRGTITIENDSGKPIHLLGCGSVYRVQLVGAGYRPSPSWPLCAREITIPTGESSYPVDVVATYDECSPHRAKGTPQCTRDGSMPPLPPGRYQAATAAVSPDLPVPAPVPVTVTPQERGYAAARNGAPTATRGR